MVGVYSADPARPTAPPHTQRINGLAEDFSGAKVLAILPVLPVPEGWVLMDGCHRACALWKVDGGAVADLIVPPHLDALAVHPLPRS